MNILFYTNNLYGGGSERVISILANHFSRSNIKVHLITDIKSKNDYSISDEVKKIHLDNRKVIFKLFNNIVRIIKISNYIKKNNIDIAISFLPNNDFRLILSSFFNKVKVISAIRNDPAKLYSKKINDFIARILYSKADAFVFQTEIIRNKFKYNVNNVKSIVINNPVSSLFFENYTSNTVSNKSFIAIGRLVEQKNFQLLIDSFYEVHKKFPETTLRIFGEGKLKDILQNIVNKYSLDSAVLILNKTDKIHIELKNSFAYVLSSIYEGLPNSLIEAMTVGLPVIATNCDGGGPASLIVNYQNGILIDNQNKDQLVQAMVYLLNNEVEARKIGSAANESMQKFRAENIVSQWIEFIDALCEEVKS